VSDTQHVPDPKGVQTVQTVHAVGKHLPGLPPWNLSVAVQVFWFALTSGMVLGCVVFTYAYLFGFIPDRYEL
jgi:hypothetical protein